MPQLKNKIAVVTGGSSGIGLATAKRFVEEGAYVFIAGRRQAEIDKSHWHWSHPNKILAIHTPLNRRFRASAR